MAYSTMSAGPGAAGHPGGGGHHGRPGDLASLDASYGGGSPMASPAGSEASTESGTVHVEAADMSVAAMEGRCSLPDALAKHRFLEYDVPPHLYEGGIEESLTTAGRYYPSHVQFRCPPLKRLLQPARRKIRLAMVVTMYNEDGDELSRTMEGIAQNVTNFQRALDAGKASGLPWQEIVVVIVSDGIEKVNESCVARAEELGMLNFDAMYTAARGTWLVNEHTGRSEWVQLVEEDTVQCHAFEFAPQLKPSPQWQREFGSRYAPVQTVFCIKQNNAGKLDSHKWFFDAFAAEFQPDFVCLIDVGTMASPKAIVNLVSTMRNNPNIGGCCGEIAVGEVESAGKKSGSKWSNFVVAAQMFEYKISHCMDKALESWFGFITVLPGAFSAYRYRALVGDGDEPRGADLRGNYRRPIDKYFASLPDPHQRDRMVAEHDAFDANMYLAEDRILCFEIVASRGKRYTLHYTKNAVAHTDVPAELASLLKQRRRWLNGSFFAMLYSLRHFGRVLTETRHPAWRKLMLGIELMYFVINMMVTWLIIGSLYLSFKLVLLSVCPEADPCQSSFMQNLSEVLTYLISFTYLLVTGCVFVLSLGNDAIAARFWFRMCGYAYAVMVILMTVIAVYGLIGASTEVLLGAITLVAVYFTSAAIHGQLPWVVGSFVQYYVMVPVFINIFTVYSFCNIHDVSWGTKGAEAASGKLVGKATKRHLGDDEAARLNDEQRAAAQKERKRLQEAADKAKAKDASFKFYRTKFVLLMMGSNWIYVTAVTQYVLPNHTDTYTKVLAVVVLGLLGIRFLGAILYQLERVLKKTCCRGYEASLRRADVSTGLLGSV